MAEKELPKWPEELPPPIEVGKMTRMNYMSTDEFSASTAIPDLIHDMFWFPEDGYFIFCEANKGIEETLSTNLKNSGIEFELSQRCFYPHPNPGYKNDFVQILPGEANYEWQKEASAKTEYSRHTLSLAAWKKKELDIAYTTESVVHASKSPSPVVSARPGMFGFSIDLIALYKKWKDRKKPNK